MIDNLNLTFLAGGFHRCDPSWNKSATGIDQCYKFYCPVGGEALVEMDDGKHLIAPGHIYFLSGFHLVRQVCRDFMEIHWVHVVPESLYLNYLLSQMRPVHFWRAEDVSFCAEGFLLMKRLFEHPFQEPSLHPGRRSLGLACHIQSILLFLIADMLESQGVEGMEEVDPLYLRLKPAIDFMHERFVDNPSLAEIARRAHLSANYFHRVFQRTFGVTPFHYMLQRRLNKARHLLAGTTLSIKEIAARTGYENPFFFSRVFKQYFHLSPQEMRRRYEKKA